MFQKILVAVDTSSLSQPVFEEALTLAQKTGARLLLLHILSPQSEDAPPAPSVFVPSYYPVISEQIMKQYQALWKAAEERGLELLRSLADQAAEVGITVEFTQNIGNPSQTICHIARDWQADLIVLGRRGHRGVGELLLGSVSNYVLHHAPCSVLTVQGRQQIAPDVAQKDQAATLS